MDGNEKTRVPEISNLFFNLKIFKAMYNIKVIPLSEANTINLGWYTSIMLILTTYFLMD